MTRRPPDNRPEKPFRQSSGWRQYFLLAVIVVLIGVGVVIWLLSR